MQDYFWNRNFMISSQRAPNTKQLSLWRLQPRCFVAAWVIVLVSCVNPPECWQAYFTKRTLHGKYRVFSSVDRCLHGSYRASFENVSSSTCCAHSLERTRHFPCKQRPTEEKIRCFPCKIRFVKYACQHSRGSMQLTKAITHAATKHNGQSCHNKSCSVLGALCDEIIKIRFWKLSYKTVTPL